MCWYRSALHSRDKKKIVGTLSHNYKIRCLKLISSSEFEIEFSRLTSQRSNSFYFFFFKFMMREIWTYLCAHHWHKIELPNCIIISFDVAIPDLSSREHLVRSKVPLPRRWWHTWKQLLSEFVFFFFLPLSLSVLIRGNSGSDVCRQLQDVSQHLFNYFIRPRFSGGIRGFTEEYFDRWGPDTKSLFQPRDNQTHYYSSSFQS